MDIEFNIDIDIEQSTTGIAEAHGHHCRLHLRFSGMPFLSFGMHSFSFRTPTFFFQTTHFFLPPQQFAMSMPVLPVLQEG